MMLLEGVVRNGKIELDPPQTLPEGARVDVSVRKDDSVDKPQPTLSDLMKLVGSLDDLPADFATEHDHYLHGTPKRAGAH